MVIKQTACKHRLPRVNTDTVDLLEIVKDNWARGVAKNNRHQMRGARQKQECFVSGNTVATIRSEPNLGALQARLAALKTLSRGQSISGMKLIATRTLESE